MSSHRDGRPSARPLEWVGLVLAGLACFASLAAAQAPAPPVPDQASRPDPLSAHRTGTFQAVLPVRSPESQADRWAERFGFGGDLTNWDYDLTEETFSLHVPADYEPEGAPYGVLVWVSPFDSGSIPEQLVDAMEERRLIWIGANDAGNPRHLFPRAGLALDAAHNVARSYNLDPDRIFISGLSGGGRMAAMLAVDYPEVFAGGFPIIGVTSYLPVRLESAPGLLVPSFPRPADITLERARRQPFVILTGHGDFNREECRLVAEAYEADGFSALHFLDIEGMGHEMPSAETFARGLDLLLGLRTD